MVHSGIRLICHASNAVQQWHRQHNEKEPPSGLATFISLPVFENLCGNKARKWWLVLFLCVQDQYGFTFH